MNLPVRLLPFLFMSTLTMTAVAADAVPNAATAEPSVESLAMQAYADGMQVGFAEYCGVSQADLNAYMGKRIQAAGRIAIDKVPGYTPERYKQDFREGREAAEVFRMTMPDDTPAYANTCAKIRAEVQAELAS